MKRRDRFDHIMVETTGMADPGPVAQTFFMDDELREQLSLDGVVTLVDAKHVLMHIEDSDEVKEQIAFADVILLNKIDLVSSTRTRPTGISNSFDERSSKDISHSRRGYRHG